jgi:hypothetical protein
MQRNAAYRLKLNQESRHLEPGTYWSAATRGYVQYAMAIDFFLGACSNATLATTFKVTA